jgi:energy-coupling factor transport system permease protein
MGSPGVYPTAVDGLEMLKFGQSGKTHHQVLVEDSPLRRADPRTKLAISLCASLAVMLPFERLLAFLVLYLLFLSWGRLLRQAGEQVWRMKWILLVLFVLDWWLIGLDLASVITLRLVLLAGVFALFFATTTASELSLALERLHVPYRYAFSVSLAFQSLGLLDDEWRAIREAQNARGALPGGSSLRKLIRRVGDLVALTVPAIVLTTKRAWSMTEAAYARGFDSPHRRPFHRLKMGFLDFLLLSGTLVVTGLLLFWR